MRTSDNTNDNGATARTVNDCGLNIIIVIMTICLLLTTCMAEVTTPGADAEKMFETAFSQYRGRNYEQAKPLLEKFVRQYGTNERVPQAYLALAVCCQKTGDSKGFDAATDEVIRRFYGSAAWLAAYNGKIKAAKAANQNETCIGFATTMLAKLPDAPDVMPDMADYASNGWDYRQRGRETPFDIVIGAYIGPDWLLDLLGVANTPELANRLLAAMSKTFALRKSELPLEWQYAHVALLRAAGQEEQAQKQWDLYLKNLGDDPRAACLWVLYAQDARARKDDKAMDAAWSVLLEKYSNFNSIVKPMYDRLEYLAANDRFDDFCKLARIYFPREAEWWRLGTILNRTVDMAKNDASRVPAVLEALDAYPAKDHWYRSRTILIRKMRLKLAANDSAGAAAMAAELYSPQYWSADSYKILEDLAASNEAFKPVLDAARKKMEIPLADPASKSAEMLKTLQGRLKDGDARLAEETAEAMLNQYPQDDATIQALSAMADYYFKKVQGDARDKWMDRMVATYKYHPLTEAVLRNQIAAEKAAKRYDRLGTAIDTLVQRFPTTMDDMDNLASLRYGCFEAAKDPAAGAAWVRKTYEPWANAGDMQAMQIIMKYEAAAHNNDNKYMGDAWMAFAKKLGDTPAGLRCLTNAWQAYFWGAMYPWPRANQQQWAKAKTAVDAIMATKSDPELLFQFSMADVNLLAAQGQAKPALAALDARIKAGQKIRDLSICLDFFSLGEALGKAKMEKETEALVKKLNAVCFTKRDRSAIDLLQANYLANSGNADGAADLYFKLLYDAKWPAMRNCLFVAGITCLRNANSNRAGQEVQKYIEKIPGVQELIPGILYDQAMTDFSVQDATSFLRTLAGRYPASRAHNELAKQIDRRNNPPPPPPPASKPAV